MGKKGGKRGAGLFALNKKRQDSKKARAEEIPTGKVFVQPTPITSAAQSVQKQLEQKERRGSEEAGRQGRNAEEEPGFQLRRRAERRDADAAAKETSAQ